MRRRGLITAGAGAVGLAITGGLAAAGGAATAGARTDTAGGASGVAPAALQDEDVTVLLDYLKQQDAKAPNATASPASTAPLHSARRSKTTATTTTHRIASTSRSGLCRLTATTGSSRASERLASC